MRIGLKPTISLIATVLVLGVMLLMLTQAVLADWETLPEEVEKQGAVYLSPGDFDLPEDVNDCLDLDGPRDDDKSDKPANRNRRRTQKRTCGREDSRRIDYSRPCGKAWSG